MQTILEACFFKMVCSFKDFKTQELGRYQSGQLGQTVNLLAYAFVGSNPALPTTSFRKVVSANLKVGISGSSSVDRALAFQAEGRGFESRLPLKFASVAQG